MSESGFAGFKDFRMNNYDDLTYKINGCAMKVHNTLGNGFQELIYQRCLAIELQEASLEFGREIVQDIRHTAGRFYS
jgi:GxxExxY protein